jgi:hypothetical protein
VPRRVPAPLLLVITSTHPPWPHCHPQIAMMGGKVSDKVAAAAVGADKGPPSKPMPVTDFLDKGLGAAQLPRKGQDRKEKEKDKRMRGQSTHAAWKSEAEMVLRQQFDS